MAIGIGELNVISNPIYDMAARLSINSCDALAGAPDVCDSFTQNII